MRVVVQILAFLSVMCVLLFASAYRMRAWPCDAKSPPVMGTLMVSDLEENAISTAADITSTTYSPGATIVWEVKPIENVIAGFTTGPPYSAVRTSETNSIYTFLLTSLMNRDARVGMSRKVVAGYRQSRFPLTKFPMVYNPRNLAVVVKNVAMRI